jgi:hypothetical protein
MDSKGNGSRKKLLRDIILIVAVLSAGVVLLIVTGSRGKAGSYAVVMVRNNETARYSLSTDGIYTINGGTNTIEIKDGKVRMTEAECPNHLCVRQGWISFSGQSIVCLPNELSVTITGADDAADFIL